MVVMAPSHAANHPFLPMESMVSSRPAVGLKRHVSACNCLPLFHRQSPTCMPPAVALAPMPGKGRVQHIVHGRRQKEFTTTKLSQHHHQPLHSFPTYMWCVRFYPYPHQVYVSSAHPTIPRAPSSAHIKSRPSLNRTAHTCTRWEPFIRPWHPSCCLLAI